MFKAKEKPTETPAAPEPPTAPAEFPQKCNSGSGTSRGYTVEVRYNHNGSSKVINGLPLGPTWTRLHFPESPIGVPRGSVFGADRHSQLLGYANAQALRWWFVAQAAEEHNDLCLETRLVVHELKYSHEDTAVGYTEHLESGGHRLELLSEGREPK